MNKHPESSALVSQADIIRREAFGARLLDPRHGDIIFRFPETGLGGHEEKTLFASSDLLCRFSPWFKQCNPPPPSSSHTHLSSSRPLQRIFLISLCLRFLTLTPS